MYECKGLRAISGRACVFQIFINRRKITAPAINLKQLNALQNSVLTIATAQIRIRIKPFRDQAALTGSRTQIYCLEGSNANRYTTNATYLFLVFQPRSTAWQAAMLTVTPPTQLFCSWFSNFPKIISVCLTG